MTTEPGQVTEKMDKAAEEARQEFEPEAAVMSAKDVALWVQKWYPLAGYKRLCRILREYAIMPQK